MFKFRSKADETVYCFRFILRGATIVVISIVNLYIFSTIPFFFLTFSLFAVVAVICG
jgi:hypothetical protein